MQTLDIGTMSSYAMEDDDEQYKKEVTPETLLSDFDAVISELDELSRELTDDTGTSPSMEGSIENLVSSVMSTIVNMIIRIVTGLTKLIAGLIVYIAKLITGMKSESDMLSSGMDDLKNSIASIKDVSMEADDPEYSITTKLSVGSAKKATSVSSVVKTVKSQSKSGRNELLTLYKQIVTNIKTVDVKEEKYIAAMAKAKTEKDLAKAFETITKFYDDTVNDSSIADPADKYYDNNYVKTELLGKWHTPSRDGITVTATIPELLAFIKFSKEEVKTNDSYRNTVKKMLDDYASFNKKYSKKIVSYNKKLLAQGKEFPALKQNHSKVLSEYTSISSEFRTLKRKNTKAMVNLATAALKLSKAKLTDLEVIGRKFKEKMLDSNNTLKAQS